MPRSTLLTCFMVSGCSPGMLIVQRIGGCVSSPDCCGAEFSFSDGIGVAGGVPACGPLSGDPPAGVLRAPLTGTEAAGVISIDANGSDSEDSPGDPSPPGVV